ncbi:MAG: phospholipase [Leptospiraceae bacterium]|nr:phospholipase [Leptospiraceae bacterium]
MLQLCFDSELYTEYIQKYIPRAREHIWIATADIKDMHVQSGKKYIPFLQVLQDLLQQQVEIQFLHAKEPGPRFRAHFDSYPAFLENPGFDRRMCPRQHSKMICVDQRWLYVGSANMTGAGLGSRGEHKRNFEAGFITDDKGFINQAADYFQSIFNGHHCDACQHYDSCPDPIQLRE